MVAEKFTHLFCYFTVENHLKSKKNMKFWRILALLISGQTKNMARSSPTDQKHDENPMMHQNICMNDFKYIQE